MSRCVCRGFNINKNCPVHGEPHKAIAEEVFRLMREQTQNEHLKEIESLQSQIAELKSENYNLKDQYKKVIEVNNEYVVRNVSLKNENTELKSELKKEKYPKNKPDPTKYDWIICPDFLQEVNDVAEEDQGEGIFDWEVIESVIIAYEK